MKRVRSERDNLHVMIPFVRTGRELAACKRLIDASGLGDEPNFHLWVMAEVPSVVHWIPAYAKLGVSGVSIGSNDLTQLVLGVDRDSEVLSAIFDERDGAVLATIEAILQASRRAGLTTSICGQAPSDFPEFARWLVEQGVTSISLNPDTAIKTALVIADEEKRLMKQAASAA